MRDADLKKLIVDEARLLGELADEMLTDAYNADPEAAHDALGENLVAELVVYGALAIPPAPPKKLADLVERQPELTHLAERVRDALHLAEVARKGVSS